MLVLVTEVSTSTCFLMLVTLICMHVLRILPLRAVWDCFDGFRHELALTRLTGCVGASTTRGRILRATILFAIIVATSCGLYYTADELWLSLVRPSNSQDFEICENSDLWNFIYAVLSLVQFLSRQIPGIGKETTSSFYTGSGAESLDKWTALAAGVDPVTCQLKYNESTRGQEKFRTAIYDAGL